MGRRREKGREKNDAYRSSRRKEWKVKKRQRFNGGKSNRNIESRSFERGQRSREPIISKTHHHYSFQPSPTRFLSPFFFLSPHTRTHVEHIFPTYLTRILEAHSSHQSTHIRIVYSNARSFIRSVSFRFVRLFEEHRIHNTLRT